MSKTLSRKQIQKMRRLSNARFPMLGVVVVATMFVVRVPILQSWASHGDVGKVQQIKQVSPTVPDEQESTKVDQVVFADEQPDAGQEIAAMDVDTSEEYDAKNWSDLLTQFEPIEPNRGIPQIDASHDRTGGLTPRPDQVDHLDDPDLRHVSQLGPQTMSNSPSKDMDPRVLTLHNPLENGGIVYFVVDEDTYSIDAGQTLALSGKDEWLMMFHRGGNFGNSRRTLKPGSYSFSVSKKGWSLK